MLIGTSLRDSCRIFHPGHARRSSQRL